MRVVFVVGLTFAAVCGFSQTVVAKGRHAMIVLQPGASATDRMAATELSTWVGKMTGTSVPVVERATAPANSIVIGQGPIASKLFPSVRFGSLGNEEVFIRSSGSSLLVAGGRPRGTIYAVDRLLNLVGVRWWAPWATTVPHSDKLVFKNISIQESPAFEYRDPYWFSAFNRDWARRNMVNGVDSLQTDADGGHITYEGFVHTYFPLVPPEKYFATHPEWYSLIKGKRQYEGAQLCTTNPELRDFVVEQVKKELAKNPTANIVSVSQNDQFGPCECDVCKALDDAQGSHSATVLALANYVADKIKTDYPNVAVDTLAYQYTRKAPKDLKPLPNVIVRLCSIECNFSAPLTDPSNASFAKDMTDWSRLTNRLYIWDYVTDFPNYMLPFPNWYSQGPNLRFFANHGGKGVFEEGAYQSFGASMAEMEAWVQAQMMWDPAQDDHKLVREFLKGYYGSSWQPIEQYLELLSNAAKNVPSNIWVGVDAPYFTFDNVANADALWAKAEALASGNPDQLWRVRMGRLPIRYVLLSRWTPLRESALKQGAKWPWPESRKAVADAWMAVAEGPGPKGWKPITHMNEGGTTPQNWIAQFAVDPPAHSGR